MKSLSSLPAPPTWPVFGNLHKMRPLIAHKVLEDWAAQYGTPFRIVLGKRSILVTSNVEAIQRILRERPNGFRRGRPVESVFAEMGIGGVFSSEGANWQKQRKLVMKAFDPAHLRDYFPSLLVATERLRKRWLKAAQLGQDVDLVADLMRYTVDVTAGLAFGVDINTIESEHAHGSGEVLQTHLDKVFPMINRRLTMPFAYWRRFKLPADRALDHHLAEVHKAITGFIAQARQRLQQEPGRQTRPHNLIEALLVSRDTEGSGFTDEDVSGNIFTALLAGEDTTANTLAWLSNFLCDETSWQDRLSAEAGRIQPKSAFDSWQEMPLHEAAIQEAMRLKPVAPVLFFEALEDCEVDGVHLPRNTPITTLMRLPSQDAQRFPDPLVFNPQRWLAPHAASADSTAGAQINTGSDASGRAPENDDAHASRSDDSIFATGSARKSLMPFGAGPRFCPGRYLAMLEIKMVCAMMAENFVISRKPGARVTERYNLSMMPEGLIVRFTERRSSLQEVAQRPAPH